MIVETMAAGTLKASDPQYNAIQQSLAQICVCLKEDFKPFLPTIIPMLKRDMELDVKFSLEDADEGAADTADGDADRKDGVQSIAIKIKGVEGAKQVSMDTFALETKITAIEIMKDIARNMGTAFYEQVETVAELCLGQLMTDRLT
jgi:importin-5